MRWSSCTCIALALGCDVEAGRVASGVVAPQPLPEPSSSVPPAAATIDLAPATPCGDAALIRFPDGDRPEHVARAANGDVFVAGHHQLVRVAADGCSIRWRLALDFAPVDIAAPDPAIGALDPDYDDVMLASADGALLTVSGDGTPLTLAAIDAAPTAIARAAYGIWIAARDGRALFVAPCMPPLVFDLGAGAIPSAIAVGDNGDAIAVGLVGDDVVAWRLAPTWPEDAPATPTLRRALGVHARSLPSLALDPSGDAFIAARIAPDAAADPDIAAHDVHRVLRLDASDLATLWSDDAPASRDDSAPHVATTATDPVDLVVTRDHDVARYAAHMPITWTVETLATRGALDITDVVGDDRGRQWVIGWTARDLGVGDFTGDPTIAHTVAGPTGFIARRPRGVGY